MLRIVPWHRVGTQQVECSVISGIKKLIVGEISSKKFPVFRALILMQGQFYVTVSGDIFGCHSLGERILLSSSS